MSMISDLVDRLRTESKSMGKYGTDYMATLLMQASATIITLSEKARADRPQGEWIPCSERLPNEREVVLITNDKGNVRFGQFRGTHGKYWIWKSNTLETVLAWMPLPKPWKGADDE